MWLGEWRGATCNKSAFMYQREKRFCWAPALVVLCGAFCAGGSLRTASVLFLFYRRRNSGSEAQWGTCPKTPCAWVRAPRCEPRPWLHLPGVLSPAPNILSHGVLNQSQILHLSFIMALSVYNNDKFITALFVCSSYRFLIKAPLLTKPL